VSYSLVPAASKTLLRGLPDISTNLLSERLKKLEQQAIIQRRILPPPAGSTVYELTEFGQGLESAILELGKWGSRLLPSSMEGLALPSLGAAALALKAFFHPEQAQAIHETYELHLGDEILQVQVADGKLTVEQGQGLPANVMLYTNMRVFMGMFAGQLKPQDAIAAGLVRVEGEPQALTRLLSLSSVGTALDNY
jgi:hypothetical protein